LCFLADHQWMGFAVILVLVSIISTLSTPPARPTEYWAATGRAAAQAAQSKRFTVFAASQREAESLGS
jgi:hypothetical protein